MYSDSTFGVDSKFLSIDKQANFKFNFKFKFNFNFNLIPRLRKFYGLADHFN